MFSYLWEWYIQISCQYTIKILAKSSEYSHVTPPSTLNSRSKTMDKSSSDISRDQIDSDNSNTLAKACRPRYSVKDSSVECLPQKQLNLATPRLFSICSISRKRISICFMIVLLYFAIKTHFKEKNMLLKQITADNIQGYTESDGFFKDVPQSRWKLWKQRVQEMRSKQNKLNKKITCPHSQRVDSKWIRFIYEKRDKARKPTVVLLYEYLLFPYKVTVSYRFITFVRSTISL